MVKNKSSKQPDFFEEKSLEMPEGYYSTEANPNLRRFVEEHATQYEPSSDDYSTPPFDKQITTNKASSIYNMHAYWSKKPYNAIQEYIRHYTKKSDVVLDPFCGSGSTALATLFEGRKAIAIDLSPISTFITKNYCTSVKSDQIAVDFRAIIEQKKQELDWLYETRCDRCDGLATIAYTVYSRVFQCTKCLEIVPIFDAFEADSLTKAGKHKKIKVCPTCFEKGSLEEIGKSGSAHFGTVPVLTNYFCREGCKPKRSERSHRDPDPKKRRFFHEYDIGKINEIDHLELPYWYPEADLATSIPYRMFIKKDFRKEDASALTDFFTKRNLWALACILDACNENDDLKFFVNSSIMASSRRAQHLDEGGGYIPGTYHLPPLAKERNVLGVVERIAKKTINARKEITQRLRSVSLLISTESATNLKNIPNETIDYIFTDPPYSGNVQYGELNFLWEMWMGFEPTNHKAEVIVNPLRDKSEAEWGLMMHQSMQECFRVLKPGRWLSLCYHDTSEGTWQLIQDIMADVGFISEKLEKALYIDTGGRTYNQYTATKVTKRDLIINFRKPRPGEIISQLTLFGDEDMATFQQKARHILTKTLIDHPGLPLDRLYDELVSKMVRKGEFERHNFDKILRSVAEEVNGRWYLLETADQVDDAESGKEESSAAHLQKFIAQYIMENPGESSVHYSNLFEQYLPIQDKPRRLLQDWLPEFFYITEEGTWRPPANEEERQQKATLRSTGTLRRIKRFANALLEGVPPHERDLPPNVATTADWIRQCRRAGFYEQGRVLYEKGGFIFDSLGEVDQMEIEEDYQICVRRSGKR
jgi:DNA modification methylase